MSKRRVVAWSILAALGLALLALLAWLCIEEFVARLLVGVFIGVGALAWAVEEVWPSPSNIPDPPPPAWPDWRYEKRVTRRSSPKAKEAN